MDKSANVNETGPASGLGKLLVARGKLAEPDLQRAERVLAISGRHAGAGAGAPGSRGRKGSRRCGLRAHGLRADRARRLSRGAGRRGAHIRRVPAAVQRAAARRRRRVPARGHGRSDRRVRAARAGDRDRPAHRAAPGAGLGSRAGARAPLRRRSLGDGPDRRRGAVGKRAAGRRRGRRAAQGHGQRRAGHPCREPRVQPRPRGARLGHPHRTLRARAQDPLPHRRRAAGRGIAARAHGARDHLAREDPLAAEHRRAPPAAGRADQAEDQRQGGRSARLHRAHAARRERGDAYPRQADAEPEPRGHRAVGQGAVGPEVGAGAAERHLPGDRDPPAAARPRRSTPCSRA